ncbi:MAG: argininosuccinate lyase [Verrucomicrobiales bacterium]|nr:argininosuccinate lyase [Verrucomicrobiales bacterium]
MWKGRFQQETSQLVQAYGESVSFDWRLYDQDIRGSIAHAGGLLRAGILTQEEFDAIRSGLEEIRHEIEHGDFEFKTALEDVHMNIEAELTRRIGPAGAKLHTARSRNDQVATDVRLYCKDAAAMLQADARQLQRALIEAAERAADAVVPGYTHLQRGQPVLFAHHLLAYVEMLERDLGRLRDAAQRADVMPLGSGALAGSTIILDREAVAKKLGFSAVTQNTMDAVSDRDFIAELLFTIALCGVHLSRLSEDIILWSSAEFGFVTLSDAHTTGSSLMPQKKNPDVAELTRGKTGRLIGNLVALLTLIKGLPMTYNRDLQEDKEPLFDTVDTLLGSLRAFADMMPHVQPKKERMRAAAIQGFSTATDLADYLVRKGLPFRDAHEVVGKAVALGVESERDLSEMSLKELQGFSAVIENDVFDCLTLEGSVAARNHQGGTAPEQVLKQAANARKLLQS